MVLKKSVISDLKKANLELDKHLETLGMSEASEKILEAKEAGGDETLNLLGTSMIDLRCEISLLRKNLSSDIENLVSRQVVESQKAFFNEMSEFQNKIFFEVKNNFASYIDEITTEFNSLKSEVLSLKNDNILTKNSLDFVKEELKTFNLAFIGNLEKTGKGIFQLSNKIDFMERRFLEFGNNLDGRDKFLESNLKRLNKKFQNFGNEFTNINSRIEVSKNLIDEKISNLENIENSNRKNNLNLIPKINSITDVNLMENEIVEPNFDGVDVFSNINTNKILEIDKRLEKLNSFR